MSRRVVVTGLGAVSALGPDTAAFLRGLQEGACAIAPVTLFDTEGLRSRLAGQVTLELEPPGRPRRRPGVGRARALALCAARQAAADAGLEPERRAAAACLLGVGAGGAEHLEATLVPKAPPERASRGHLLDFPPAHATCAVAEALGLGGARLSIMTACSSSALAIGQGAALVRRGAVEVAFVGGVEPLCRLTFLGFSALRALSAAPCRPFDAERRGLSLGEGAAVLVLEEAHAARARGARIHAELAGFGASADGHHMTAPHPDGSGAAQAMRAALASGGLLPGDIDYINAHGTATEQGDLAEARAIHAVFGPHASRLCVSSTKSQIGHTLGAAGALEAVATVLAIAHGFAPPTVNLDRPDPACDLDVVAAKPRPLSIRAALSSSFAFGGNNAALAFVKAG